MMYVSSEMRDCNGVELRALLLPHQWALPGDTALDRLFIYSGSSFLVPGGLSLMLLSDNTLTSPSGGWHYCIILDSFHAGQQWMNKAKGLIQIQVNPWTWLFLKRSWVIKNSSVITGQEWILQKVPATWFISAKCSEDEFLFFIFCLFPTVS